MTEAEAKIERNEAATRQEQCEVRAQKAKGNVAYRIAREIDTFTGDVKEGKLWVCDCKHTENGEDTFYIESGDINKGLDEVEKWLDVVGRYGVPVGFRVEVYFRRHRSKNKKYIYVDERHRNHTIKIKRGKRISMTIL